MPNIKKIKKANKSDYPIIDIRNFGPIREGQIELKPLTVFIGPNNSGKSYAAILVNSIFKAYESAKSLDRGFFHSGIDYLGMDFGKKTIENKLYNNPAFIEYLEKLRTNVKSRIPNFIQDTINSFFIDAMFKRGIGDELSINFANETRELTRIGCNQFKIGFTFNDIQAKFPKDNKIISNDLPNLRNYLSLIFLSKSMIIKNEDTNSWVEVSFMNRKKSDKTIRRNILEIAFTFCGTSFFKKMKALGKACYYLPAARSGIVQMPTILATSIIEQYSYTNNKKSANPHLPGGVIKFLSSIINLNPKEGEFYNLARRMENELINGQIIVLRSKESKTIELKYRFKERDIPIGIASSTVSEIAPIVIYMKHILKSESILIIEEPEAHLHPDNQRILAKYLVRLIRGGVKILITTHSEYLLEQLSNFMLMTQISNKDKRKYKKDGILENDYLKPDEANVYLFKEDKKTKSYNVEPVEIDIEYGISQDAFIRINDSLYKQTINIRRDLNLE